PSIEISSGGRASPGPVTLICSSTVSPTAASELLRTAVTLGVSACRICALATRAIATSKIRQCMEISANYQPSALTSRYRHDALLCVHQVGLAPLRLSLIQAAPAPGVRSSDLLSPVLPRPPARSYGVAFANSLLPRLSLRRRILFSAIPRGWGSRSHLRLLRVTATAFRFPLRLDSAIVQPAAVLATAKADSVAAFLRRATAMEFHRAVVAAVSSAVRFLPGTGLVAVVAFALCRWPSRFATGGFVPAADPFDPAGSGFAVVAAAAAVAAAAVAAVAAVVVAVADLSVAAGPVSVGSAVFAVDLACSVCSFAVALGKGRVVAVPFCFLTHRSSF